MRKIAIIFSLLLGLLSSSEVNAQTLDLGGTVWNNDIIGWTDLHTLSFTSHNYGTARSMAMGNAFTALGADMVSASLNPAGIGMYTRSDVNISPMLQVIKSPTSGERYYSSNTPSRDQEFKETTTRFGFSNMGAIFNVYTGTGALTNLNIGVTYNRIADFNRSMLTASRYNPATESMANLFCLEATLDKLAPNDKGNMPYGYDPRFWGATLAYNSYLINHDEQGWYIDSIAETSEVDQYSAINTRGSLGEFALTAGLNFLDIFYLGASIGIQSLRYRHEVFYGENYYHQPDSGLEYELDYMNYLQYTDLSGTGINFKIGITARPVEWLRLGVAFHTPTYFTTVLHYNASMWNEAFNTTTGRYDYKEAATPGWSDEGANAWRYRTPTRLLSGAAVTIAKRLILSLDYEHSWYQNTKLQRSPIYGLDYSAQIREVLKDSGTLRAGVEFCATPYLSIRGGFIWSDSAVKSSYDDLLATHIMPTSQYYITGGLGIQLNRSAYIDFAYQYGSTHYAQSANFYGYFDDNTGVDIVSEVFSTKSNKHMAVLTFGWRF